MKPLARLGLTAAIAILLLGLCLLPQLGIRTLYAVFFRAQASALFGLKGEKHTLEIHAQPDGSRGSDVAVVISTRGAPRSLRVGFMSYFGFLPTAFVAALVAATAMPWRRKLRALVWGILLVDFYVIAGSGLTILRAWSVHARECAYPHSALVASAGWSRALDGLDSLLTRSPSINLLIAVLAWVAVTAREWWPALTSHARDPTSRTGRAAE